MPINKKIIAGASVLALAVGAGLMVRAAGTFTPEAQPIGYVGQPAVSSVDVSKGTALLYAISYSARDWSGDLHAYPVSPNGTVGTVDTWGDGASSKVKAQSKADARLIVTIKNGAGIPFQWNDLSTGAGGQRQQLDPAAAAASATSSLVLDYIRGSDANEGTAAGKFRPRNYGLGDMIHSTPVFWNDGVNKTIFVGANDGMLHAFNAADGSERFAYVPAVLLPKLGALTNQAYSHNYYVDGRLDVKKFETKTILAGTLGGGGKAVFALNVSTTAPTDEANAAAKVLWEISNQHPDYAELGNTYGAPVLTTLPDGRDALVIGNGYNNDGNGHAVLYVINAHTGALIKAFDTGSGSEASPNGLSSPSLWDSDGDKIKDTVYAGDVDGNLWKFSLASGFATPVRKLHTNTLGAAQAITMAPGLLHHPLGGVMVNFVTGRMLEKSDAANAVAHYAYGIWDGAPSQNAQLLEQELKEENYLGVTDHTIRVRRATSNQPNWTAGAGNHRGWRTVLPINGERVVGDGAFVTGEVFQFFATNPTINPDVLPSGENWWMQLNALTGGNAGTTLFDLNDDAEFTSDDQVALTVAGVETRYDPVGRHMGPGVRSQLIALSAGAVDVYQSNLDRNSAPPEETVVVTTATVDGQRGVSGGHFDTDFFCYQNCGAATSTYTTIRSPKGIYSVGQENGGDLDNLNYVHVHEYDDIYDRTGINMQNPSQDMQRVDLAKATTATTYAPNTPSLQGNETYPSSGVTVVSTNTSRKSAKDVPSKSYSYSHTAQVVNAGSPTTVTTASGTTITTTSKYTTTLTIGEALNVGNRDNRRYYPYDWRVTVRRWDTTVTRTDTFPNVRFKVLMSNQAYSPAVKLTIGGAEDPALTNATFNDNVFRYQTASGLKVNQLPSYKLASLSNLVFSMPLDAFNIKDWGTGVSRTGLHPIRPQCAGVAVDAPTPGPSGEWRGGALTLQLVDPAITDADITLNVAGKPELGYRLKSSLVKTKLIAEYLIYWHHPNNKCMGDSGWTRTPPQDNSESDAINGIWAAGENDPRGVFQPGSGEQSTVVPPPPAPVIVQNPDGSTTITTVEHTALSSGGYTVTTTVRTIPPQLSNTTGIVTGGAVSGSGLDIDTGGVNKNAANLGRINWRELQR